MQVYYDQYLQNEILKVDQPGVVFNKVEFRNPFVGLGVTKTQSIKSKFRD